jgi:hypothetical protein
MKVGVLATMIFGALIGYPLASMAGLAPDNDTDGIPDVLDKCRTDTRNVVATCDTDQDGYGNVCDPDFTQDELVLPGDFTGHFQPSFKAGVPAPTGTDMNCDGLMLPGDFTGFFQPQFKAGSLGPSGLSCAGTVPCN